MRYAEQFQAYADAEDMEPLFLTGDTLHILSQLPNNSIDFCMTSPLRCHDCAMIVP
jgi:DNA modification methylase